MSSAFTVFAARAAASAAVALVMLVALGVGYALIEAAGLSLLQRLNSDEIVGRAFAVVEAGYWLTTGIGAMLAPPAVALLGRRGAVIAAGACLPLVVGLRWRALARFEELAVVPEREFAVLRRLSVFAPLPMATVENLARRVSRRLVKAGEVVIRRGDAGEDFFVVADGALEVGDCDGTPPPLVPGDCFGEIALLNSVRRTATVTAAAVRGRRRRGARARRRMGASCASRRARRLPGAGSRRATSTSCSKDAPTPSATAGSSRRSGRATSSARSGPSTGAPATATRAWPPSPRPSRCGCSSSPRATSAA